MEFFNKYFKNGMNRLGNGEYEVRCPFPHTTPDGKRYYESRPSAHVNPDKDVFHCKVCDARHSETSFLAHVQGMEYKDAKRLLSRFKQSDSEHWEQWEDKLNNNEEKMKLVGDLGILPVKNELRLGWQGSGIAFPVFMYDELMDVRTYTPDESPKVKSEPGAKPLVLPFDLWRNDERDTLLCAGEKDMAIARTHGFNAITFTGGEGAFPKLFKYSFKGKRIFIAYDNDGAGVEGAKKVATHLKDAGADPFIVDLSLVCADKGEDIHDFFIKYKKSANDLQKLMDEAEPFSQEQFDEVRNEIFPLVSLEESTHGKYTNRIISSRVNVIATYEEAFEVPEYVHYKKMNANSGNNNTVDIGWIGEWMLDESNCEDLLYLCDSNLKEKDINANLNELVRLHPKEAFMRRIVSSKRRVFKAHVTDDTESEETEGQPFELTVYSFERLHSGQKYRIFYKRMPHPYQSQKIVGVVTRIEESDNSINSFQVNDSTIDSLKCFQAEPGKLNEKMKEIVERSKAFVGVEIVDKVVLATELFYHTPLWFRFGDRKERAYLDAMIIGDSRTGKSQTAQRMMEMYELGTFTSLKTASVPGLIGGSDKTNNGMKTKLGVLPRNNKGAVVMEEFSDGGKEVAKKLTEIRSSNRVRLDRVNGSMTAEAMVRMLSISNPSKSANGTNLPIRQYPNGIKLIIQLVGASEDIARYDYFMIVEEPETYTAPTETASLDAFPKESYLNRIRWIWSRSEDQVVIDDEVQRYIVSQAEKLNRNYNCSVKLFGAEAWKKLSRVAIAVAATVCSMDETGENLVVTKEHVQWASNFLIACYDNSIFRLKEFVGEERKFTECDQHAVSALEGVYSNHPTLVNQMEMATELSQQQLKSISGLDQNDFAKVMNRLAECHFFRWSGDKIVPSERFRKALPKINRNLYMKGVGAS